jgi:GDP-D-mannose dehydratase
MARRALVTGIGGQDRPYLAELLLGGGYDFWYHVRFREGEAGRDRAHRARLDDGEAVAAAIQELKPDETNQRELA